MRNSKGQFIKGKKSDKRGITLTGKGQICACCKKDKKIEDFGKNSQRFNGIHVYCKSCCREKRQEYKEFNKQYSKDYYDKNKEKLLIDSKERHKKNREKNIAQQKRYYEENKHKILKHNKNWAKENREKSNEIKKTWKDNNPWSSSYYSSIRRSRKLNQTPEWADKEKIKEIYVNCPDGMEVDHIIPISRGGLHCANNLQYLTPEENRRKHNKLPHEFNKLTKKASAS